MVRTHAFTALTCLTGRKKKKNTLTLTHSWISFSTSKAQTLSWVGVQQVVDKFIDPFWKLLFWIPWPNLDLSLYLHQTFDTGLNKLSSHTHTQTGQNWNLVLLTHVTVLSSIPHSVRSNREWSPATSPSLPSRALPYNPNELQECP